MIRDRRRVATCVGFGPRFLHSTGQAYKGGPNSGVFLQITADDRRRILAVPGRATASASSRRPRRAATSTCSPSAAGGPCASTSAATSQPAWHGSRRRSSEGWPDTRTRARRHEPQGDDACSSGVIGLGRMGGNIVRRLHAGWPSVRRLSTETPQAVRDAGRAKAPTARSDLTRSRRQARHAARRLGHAAGRRERPKRRSSQLGELMQPATSSSTAATPSTRTTSAAPRALAHKGIHYVDVGTTGGVWGLERGYCMMIGGDKEAVEHLDPIFAALAPGRATSRARPAARVAIRAPSAATSTAGPAGAGHFVKMVHNGIEYGLMQAYAEGFDILRNATPRRRCPETQRFDLDLADIAEVWRRGSVISSWLLDLTRDGAGREREPRELFTGSVAGFRRRPLDRHGGDRGGSAGRRAVGGALRPLPLAPGAYLRRTLLSAMRQVRRPRRTTRRRVGEHGRHDTARSAVIRRSQHGAAMRARDLRRIGRPHQAPAGAGALQSRARAAARPAFAIVGVDHNQRSDEQFRTI